LAVPLSTEESVKPRGLVPHHFAYRVEGATFAEQQSGAWLSSMRRVQHFRFITGGGCLDVLTVSEPEFTLAPTMQEASRS
jgi:hypothetical protein